ncbi:hypothetical protein ALP05_04474 [Pseudomonas caricapapayae]|uniref:Outer membrane efflux protein n=1 Tax=Pseudomonas caricapapayae TaxID=46678 RepID=A0A3M6F2S1_9PSED|nr:TolC family protein [Pseudomonas caricapapayae]RMV74753.1 hypothetical protein ALP05_04474 [Pseudomonas caricapapayae]
MNAPVFHVLPLRLAVIIAVFGFNGCAVTLEPLTNEQQLASAFDDQQHMFAEQEPVTHPISLEEATARAVKYNLQQRLGLMQRALEDNLLNVSQLSMLPQLAASAGWQGRDNVLGSSSKSVTSGEQSLEPSTSSDRTSRDGQLRLSWNVLDFGVSYFSAKAQANKALAAEEARRKVVADIIQQVREAYWQAASAERLRPELQHALAAARAALAQAQVTEHERLLAPVESLRYQKSLLEMARQLEAVDGELAIAKARLAGLMSLPPNTAYSLAAPAADVGNAPTMAYSLPDLETTAMVRRPEIRTETYQARNAVLETRSAMLKLLPGVGLFAGTNYDSNSYLVNDNWADVGMRVSWNLFNILAYPALKQAGETREQVGELRRQAMRMAVLTQVNVAWHEYQRAGQVFARSSELEQLQRGILRQSDSAYGNQAQSRLERVRVSTETVLATRTRDRSFAELQVAYGAVYQAAGLDPLPDRIADSSLGTLSRAIASNSQHLGRGQGVIPAQIAAQPAAAQFPAPLLAVARPALAVRKMAPHPVHVDLWDSLGSLRSAEVVSAEANDAH